MTIMREQSLREFEFWSGAKPVADRLSYDELDTIEEALSECGPMDETAINDFFWFDTETLCEWLGITEDELWAREV